MWDEHVLIIFFNESGIPVLMPWSIQMQCWSCSFGNMRHPMLDHNTKINVYFEKSVMNVCGLSGVIGSLQ